MKKKIKSRWNSFGRGSVIVGTLMVFLAWIIFNYITNPFIHQSFEEILGFGFILIITGLIFVFFGKKLEA